ncbi:helix-loop-helix DNA-binding domain-containing protein [Botrytis cinerea]
MLAIQRLNMGSSKPPDLDMPFGYAFDSHSTFPFPSPTAPAPGPPLLDDSESNLLDTFFDGVSSDHFNYDFFPNTQDGGNLEGVGRITPGFHGDEGYF